MCVDKFELICFLGYTKTLRIQTGQYRRSWIQTLQGPPPFSIPIGLVRMNACDWLLSIKALESLASAMKALHNQFLHLNDLNFT